MAEALSTSSDLSHPILNLTPEEKRVFGQLFARADTEKIGVVTGEVAVKFFEPTKLPAPVLGEIWQIADTENRGLLTSSGFCIVLRLIGHYQAGRDPSPELAFQPGPLPKFEGLNVPSSAPAPSLPGPIQPQLSGGGPIRVPPLTPDKVAEYSALFGSLGAQNGVLSGETAKNIFEKARLSNDTLGRIWNLADTQLRGALDMTEFIIAMHLIASYKSGLLKALPSNLPPGLYEAASRRGPAPALRLSGGARPGEPVAISRQFTGQGPQRAASPLSRPPYPNAPQTPQSSGLDWVITPQEKAAYDELFNKVDTASRGYITGEQAVLFFSNSGLPEDILATIWDLADINSEGRLSRDEFAVAMYLIKQQKPRPGQPRLNLPASLPPNLVPPSMRNQARPAQQPTAPAFDNAAFATPKPASEDLFGLDAFSSPIPAQSTGGSVSYNKPVETDPFGNKSISPTSPQAAISPAPRNPASMFKPFQPSSTFGQGLTTQTTGASATSSQPQIRGPPTSAMDDLLGDNDPEVSSKLTQETTELANMSNQIGTLRNQMQDVQQKKSVTESDLSSAGKQKRELEQRLAQFRSQYEQEVKQVKALEEQLAASRNDTRKLHQELAMVEGTHQDLQTQHRQVLGALEADQRENASLKERIRNLNTEISQLRPQLDKMRSDARQQKGMVAINKKQLATNEGERDRMRSELADLTKAEQEQQQQQRREQERAAAVVSPAVSERSNTNPFFRKSSATASENVMSPAGFNREESQRDFDNIFGPSVASLQTSAPPQTSFKNEPQTSGFSTQSGPSVVSSGPDVPTPSTSPPASTYQDSPRANEPPPPPESRVFSSPFLPIREGAPRNSSFSSSVNVSAPASRYGGGAAGVETPTNVEATSPAATPIQERKVSRGSDRPEASRSDTGSFINSALNRNQTSSPAASTTSDAARSGSKSEEPKDPDQSFGPPSNLKDLPGAFPTEAADSIQPTPTGESAASEQSKSSTRPSEGFSSTRTDPFSSMNGSQTRGPSTAKHDFDAAFAGVGGSQAAQERQNTGSSLNGSADNASASKFSREFPPIENLDHEEDSDSTSEPGFDDDFTAASPKPKAESVNAPSQSQPSRPLTSTTNVEEQSDYGFRPRPSVSQVDSSASLPPASAQKSPPTYEQAVSPPGGSRQPRDSNQFPPEFSGLLPSREDPTSPTHVSQPSEKSFSPPPPTQGQTLFGSSSSTRGVPSVTSNMFPGYPLPSQTSASTGPSDAYYPPASYSTGEGAQQPATQQPQMSRPSYQDDFDTGFDDLDEAKEADGKGEDDFSFSSPHREGFDDFNPVFDSPAASKSTMTSQQTPTGMTIHDDFSDFDQHLSGYGSTSSKAPQQPHANTAQDWDAIFSSLDTPQENKLSSEPIKSPFPATAGMSGNGTGGTGFSSSGMRGGESSSSTQNQQNMPQLGRALSAGTEHDDPILKKLTGMGYPRQDALNALEKFDYDINKAADYLTSGQ
ncbi:hypothetical protein W97_00850 [Coniosporium apollinis CBS 100218]|uniref:UBA/TS-N domain-containing protein n=1 Tax=Coniosporium apollinis (strain CBS 100218) TaxID=1168221 RepID=R7YIB0_CONA1|nr:uncharacterized protein W97_00850 [Coniosporium apollinis CBS 100218]EON61635.1 hypothetical protein W97_00850 [Coniosporium apollinis CBS 100218]